MAYIRKITNKKGVVWRAEVEVGDARDSSRFPTKPEAQAWAMRREAELARDGRLIGGQTVGDALKRWRDEISVTRKGATAEGVRIRRLLNDPIARRLLAHVTLEDAEDYRDRRLAEIKPNSVIRELTVLKAVVRRSVRWRWLDSYPWNDLEQPKPGRARTRVYTPAEIRAIEEAACIADGAVVRSQMQRTGIAFLFALETAMRQGEIAGLAPGDIDTARRVAHLDDTKNGDPRDVPLSSRAVALLERLPTDSDAVFGVAANTMSQLFTRIRRRAGVQGATFHDARRCATVALSRKLDVLELARVTGHRDIKMLLVYYQRDAAELARKLD